MRKVTTTSMWIRQQSYTNRVFHIQGEVGSLGKKSTTQGPSTL